MAEINDKELDAAQDAAAAFTARKTTITFNAPWCWEGKEYTSIDFNWDALTGYDLLAAEDEVSSSGRIIVARELNTEFLICIAAKACTVPIGSDAIKAMPILATHKIANAVRSIFMRSEL